MWLRLSGMMTVSQCFQTVASTSFGAVQVWLVNSSTALRKPSPFWVATTFQP